MDGWKRSQEKEREGVGHLEQVRPVSAMTDMSCSPELLGSVISRLT
jgi:hypothetical protein